MLGKRCLPVPTPNRCCLAACLLLALAGGARAAAPERQTWRMAVILVSLSDLPNPIFPNLARNDTFTEPGSMRAFLLEQTGGLVDLTGEVLGPITVPINSSQACAGRESLAASAAMGLLGTAGIDVSNYDFLTFAMPQDSCGWSSGQFGSSFFCWGSSCPGGTPGNPNNIHALSQGLAWSLRLPLVPTRRCTDASGTAVTVSANCTDSGRDPLDLWGSQQGGAPRSISGVSKLQAGLMDPTQCVNVESPGTYALEPVETRGAGTQVLRLFRGFKDHRPEFYYLDFRQPVGNWRLPDASAAFTGVTLRLGSGSPGLVHDPVLLDATPLTGSFEDAPLGVGRSFSDPVTGLTVTTVSTGAAGSQVKVEWPGSLAGLPPGAGTGLTGRYFAGGHELRLTRTDPGIDFQWGEDAPDPALPADGFGVRWTGYLVPRFTESYTLHTLSDDGIRVRIDGRLVIDRFNGHTPTHDTGSIALTAGRHHAVEIEYFEIDQGAVLQLGWASRNQPYQIIPASQLLPGEPEGSTSGGVLTPELPPPPPPPPGRSMPIVSAVGGCNSLPGTGALAAGVGALLLTSRKRRRM
jgi:hypothetical protein